MIKPGHVKLGLLILSITGLINFVYGIVAGFCEDWFRMALGFTTAILCSVFSAVIKLSHEINKAVERIEKNGLGNNGESST